MISGIYKLTFASGRYYIGKSIDIPTRWRQHYEKLCKGTGAVKLQIEFNRYHDYNQEVLMYCHPDHIDIMETYYINCGDRGLMLNTTFPPPLSRAEYEHILSNPRLLEHSTAAHVKVLSEYAAEVRSLREEIKSLRNKPPVIIKEYGDATAFIEELLVEIDDLETEHLANLRELEAKYADTRIKNRSWLQRLFG